MRPDTGTGSRLIIHPWKEGFGLGLPYFSFCMG